MEKIQPNIAACLITPGHISSNPRLVKEAMALTTAGICVHIIFTQYVDYLIDHDQQILDANPEWTYNKLNWAQTSLISKVLRVISGIIRFIPNINTRINRNFFWQLKKAIAYPADIYIAHNPGALPVAVIAAKKKKVKCGFDAEDFHRNETTDDENSEDVKLKKAIENANIPQLDYIIAASPQIAGKYVELFKRDVPPILNVFPKTNLKVINNIDRPLQIFWFSQTIGQKRGLEDLIEAINISKVKMDLHLLGKISDSYKSQLLGLNDKYEQPTAILNFHKPVPESELFAITARYDIGFAGEPGFSTNNKIVLSNKIFTYIQCGLAVVASATISQTWLLEQYPGIGELYDGTSELVKVLLAYHNNRELLYETKKAAYEIGQTDLNWEVESKKIISVIQPLFAERA